MADLFTLKLPDFGEGVTEAEIVTWYVNVGDIVDDGQDLLDVMTDKATIEVPSPVSGEVISLIGEVGDKITVGTALAQIRPAGASSQITEAQADETLSEEAQIKAPDTNTTPLIEDKADVTSNNADGAKPLAAPHIRARATERGIALEAVTGTGPGGRITAADLDKYIAAQGLEDLGKDPAQPHHIEPKTGKKTHKIIGMRRKIAQRMQEACRAIPHFSYIEEFDLTALEALRADLNRNRRPEQNKLTLLPFFIRAVVLAQPHFPNVNAHFDDENNELHCFEGVHMGIATQTNKGLMVPVIRHAETLSLWDCAAQIEHITAQARAGTIAREALSGSTITLSSLGKLGGIAATPIINAPEVAIVGPNRLIKRPALIEGVLQTRMMMNLSSSFDHRIIDGHEAARFIQHIKRLIEQPALLFMDAA